MIFKKATLFRSYLFDRTIGKMGDLSTLERPWIENKPNISCVSEGLYLIFRDRSGRHQYYRIEHVTGRTHIEFHGGYLPTHSDGCVLVGTGFDEKFNLIGSDDALAKMLDTYGDDPFLLNIRQFNPNTDTW